MGDYSLNNGSYYGRAVNQDIFFAYASITAPVIYSTAAGTGGPLLWNGSNLQINKVMASIIGVTCALTTVSTVAAALGITGNNGQTAAPTSTTAITASGPSYVGGPPSLCTAYSVGTVTNAGNFFLPLIGLSTGALTVNNVALGFIDLQGLIAVPPGGWVSLAASATATTTVAKLGLIWAEVPI